MNWTRLVLDEAQKESFSQRLPYLGSVEKIIQTHASIVLIFEKHVIKIKKNVNFGFLDFSSREKRIHACQDEVRLNSRLSPEVYIGLIGLEQDPTNSLLQLTPEFSSKDKQEAVILMHRLDERFSWKQRLQLSPPKKKDLDSIIKTLKKFYHSSQPTKNSHYGKRIQKAFLENLDFQKDSRLQPFLKTTSIQLLNSQESIIQERENQGWIRDCHGDLHLEHIYWHKDGTPQIIDCIEFNKDFRLIDPASDIAFLLMDLDLSGFVQESQSLYRKYLAEIEAGQYKLTDIQYKNLFQIYKIYRANVRFKVNMIRSLDKEVNPEDQKSSIQLSDKYEVLALRYILQGGLLNKTAICIMGKIGTGKSTLAKLISEKLRINLYSSDAIRKELAGLPIQGLPSKEDRDRIYTPEYTKKTYQKLVEIGIDEGSQGQSVILDATFAKSSFRKEAILGLKKSYSRILFLESTASKETVYQRLEKRSNDPLSISDARIQEFEKLDPFFEAWTDEEGINNEDLIISHLFWVTD
jgi:aminoglycoside phosphotransferase family enzyme/predicted kinase